MHWCRRASVSSQAPAGWLRLATAGFLLAAPDTARGLLVPLGPPDTRPLYLVRGPGGLTARPHGRPGRSHLDMGKRSVPRDLSMHKPKAARKNAKHDGDGAAGGAMESFEQLAREISRDVYSRSQQHFSSLDHCPALVLNADYQPLSYLPLSLWPWQDVIKAIFMGKAAVVSTYADRVIRSARMEMALPSVIALKQYVRFDNGGNAFTRRNVYLRDGFTCQYCERVFRYVDLSFDHVLPRKLGGRSNWENVVACCNPCNNRKGDCHPKDLKKLRMRLRSKPREPSYHELQALARQHPPNLMHDTWEQFLYVDSSWGDLSPAAGAGQELA